MSIVHNTSFFLQCLYFLLVADCLSLLHPTTPRAQKYARTITVRAKHTSTFQFTFTFHASILSNKGFRPPSSSDSTSTKSPTAAMATPVLSEHRKIDLQSPADLAYIHSHISHAARDKIDRALPPAAAPAGEDDKLRRRVEELVDGYVKNLWEGVRMNVRVNGIDVTGIGEEGDVVGREVGDVEDGE